MARLVMPWSVWLFAVLVVTALLTAPGHWFPWWSANKIPGTKLGWGKLLHASAYMSLAISAGWLPARLSVRQWLMLALIIHGGFTELVQLTMPNRGASFLDWGIDSVSVVVGWLLSRRYWPA